MSKQLVERRAEEMSCARLMGGGGRKKRLADCCRPARDKIRVGQTARQQPVCSPHFTRATKRSLSGELAKLEFKREKERSAARAARLALKWSGTGRARQKLPLFILRLLRAPSANSNSSLFFASHLRHYKESCANEGALFIELRAA